MTRQLIADTETTGLDYKKGHRLIEAAFLEMIDGKLTGEKYHTYLQPYRLVDEGAFKCHGIGDAQLADKPRFKDIADDMKAFIGDSNLIFHNAPFDTGFLANEFKLIGAPDEENPILKNTIVCTLKIARSKFGYYNNKLDDLCDRFSIDKSGRTLHGALIDCELLYEVYCKLLEINHE
jgi:DNA polymerase III subunit epsilon